MITGSWKSQQLGNVVTLQRGFDLPHRLRKPGEVPIVTSSGVEDTHSEARVKAPGVVTGRYGTIGDVYFIREDFWPHNTTLYVRDFHGNEPLFVSYLLRTIDFHMHSGKSGVPGVNRNDLHEIIVTIPSTLAEQSAISGTLSDADALIESMEQLITKKRQVKQGAMQELLTGKKRLPGFKVKHGYKQTELGMIPEDWDIVPIGRLVSEFRGGAPLKPSDFTRSGIKVLPKGGVGRTGWLKIENSDLQYCSPQYAMTHQRNQVDETFTIVVLRDLVPSGPSIGLMVQIRDTEPFVLAQGVYGFKLNQSAVPKYLVQLSNTRWYRKMVNSIMVGSTQVHITNKAFKKAQIPLPSLPEQDAIATILSDMDSEITVLEDKLTKARQLKQGMMQELLTGRIRLVSAASKAVPLILKKEVHSEPIKPHNWAINEAVVIAVITKNFGSEQYPLGRKRYTKVSYLLHRHAERQAVGYVKKAAGPYNPSTKYKGPENIALKNGYIRRHTRDQFSGFVAADNIANAEEYFLKWYGKDSLTWIQQFKKKSNDELELLATVDMAMEDLRREDKPVELDSVKQVIHDHPEWKDKLDRQIFSDVNIATAIKTCSKLFT